jgi:hypothetical protein
VFVACGVVGLAGLVVAGPVLSRESTRQKSLQPPESNSPSAD